MKRWRDDDRLIVWDITADQAKRGCYEEKDDIMVKSKQNRNNSRDKRTEEE